VLADDAVFTFRCHNPAHDVGIADHRTDSSGLGTASSNPVQFNINQPPGSAAIFVNQNNSGVCVARVSSNHIITAGRGEFRPDGSSTEQGRNLSRVPEDWINSRVVVTATKQGNREIVFAVRSTQHERKGSVTLNFFIEYRAAS